MSTVNSRINLAKALMSFGSQLPGLVESNRKYRDEMELAPLRKKLFEQQVDAGDRQATEDQFTMDQKRTEEENKAAAQNTLASVVDSFNNQNLYDNLPETIRNPDYQKKPVRDIAVESGLPKYAGDDNVKQFMSDFVTKPEEIQIKKDKPLTGLGVTTQQKREDWNKIASMEDGPEKDKAIDDYMMVYAPGTKYPLTGKGINEKINLENSLIPIESEKERAKNKAGKIGTNEGETESNLTAIPGFKPVQGARITDDSVKKVKSAASQLELFDKMIGDIKSKYAKSGSVFTGDDAADFQSKILNLQMLAKNEGLYNLGVLTGNDYQLLQRAIPDPSSIKEGVKKQVLGDLMVRFDNFQQLLNDKGSTFYRLNGFEKEQSKKDSPPQPNTTKTYSDAAITQAKAALNDPSAPESVKAKARKVLGQ